MTTAKPTDQAITTGGNVLNGQEGSLTATCPAGTIALDGSGGWLGAIPGRSTDLGWRRGREPVCRLPTRMSYVLLDPSISQPSPARLTPWSRRRSA